MINTRCPAATRDPDGGGLLERGVRRFVGEFVLPGGGILGEGTPAHPEHLVTHAEPGHRRTDRGDGPGDIHPGHPVLRPAEPEPHDPHQIRRARHQVPRPPVKTGRVHPHQYLVVGDLGSFDLRRTQLIGRAVAVLHDRLHHSVPWWPVWAAAVCLLSNLIIASLSAGWMVHVDVLSTGLYSY